MALVAVPESDGVWTVPLGVAGAGAAGEGAVYLESLRALRTEPAGRRRVWIQPEDDVPHIRDRVLRVRDAVGLRPSQVSVADSLVSATADVLGTHNLLLCSRAQANELGLSWQPIGELRLARGFGLAAAVADDAERLRACAVGIARCLGAEGGAG